MSDNDKLYLGCPIQHARQFLAGKWQMGILWNLKDKPLSFSEIKNLLPEISDKMLMQELNFFVEKKIIERNTLSFQSVRASYTLSAIGRSLIPIITSIVAWGYLHLQDERCTQDMDRTPLSVIDAIEKGMYETE